MVTTTSRTKPKPGYKETEVGAIPEDWELKTLGEVATISSGGTPDRQRSVYWGGDIPWITTTQIDFNTVREANEFITRIGLENSAARVYNAGTLLMAMYGQGKTRGKVAILGISAAINQACAAIQVNKDVSKEYVFHNLAARYDEIRSLSNIGNQENLNSNIIKNILLPLPGEKEQRLIASTLSDVADLLTSLDQLIAKKLGIKQATMQQLLTGKSRLPGFTDKWRETKLRDVATVLKGTGLSKNQLANSGRTPCILYGELFTTYQRVISEVVSHTDSVQGTPSKYGDVLVPGSTTTVGVDLATASALLHSDVLVGGDINIIRSRGSAYSPAFLAHYLTEVKRREIAERAQGITIVHLYGRDLLELELSVPSLKEQMGIVETLADMDAEIAVLEQRRDKIQAVRQGMMQELLTGRKRLV